MIPAFLSNWSILTGFLGFVAASVFVINRIIGVWEEDRDLDVEIALHNALTDFVDGLNAGSN